MKSEKKVEVSKDIIYPIKYYFNTLKTKLKADFICATIENLILWATNSWYDLFVKQAKYRYYRQNFIEDNI